MEKLTAQQKLSVVREARKLYIESLNEYDPDNYKVICSSLGHALESKELVNSYWNCKLVQKMLPELMAHKPEQLYNDYRDLWWPREDTKTRLEVFDKLETEYVAQVEASLPWYTKLFNKIKKIF